MPQAPLQGVQRQVQAKGTGLMPTEHFIVLNLKLNNNTVILREGQTQEDEELEDLAADHQADPLQDFQQEQEEPLHLRDLHHPEHQVGTMSGPIMWTGVHGTSATGQLTARSQQSLPRTRSTEQSRPGQIGGIWPATTC